MTGVLKDQRNVKRWEQHSEGGLSKVKGPAVRTDFLHCGWCVVLSVGRGEALQGPGGCDGAGTELVPEAEQGYWRASGPRTVALVLQPLDSSLPACGSQQSCWRSGKSGLNWCGQLRTGCGLPGQGRCLVRGRPTARNLVLLLPWRPWWVWVDRCQGPYSQRTYNGRDAYKPGGGTVSSAWQFGHRLWGQRACGCAPD